MKNMLLKSAVLAIASVGLLAGSALAMGFPFADFQGAISYDVEHVLPTQNTVSITGYADKNGAYVTSSDSFIGQTVAGSMLSGINYDFATDTLTINPSATAAFYIGSPDGTDPYLTATASNFSSTKLATGIYTISASLSNQNYFHTADSAFMAQYEAASPASGIQGELMTWDVVFGLPTSGNDPGYDYMVNVSGKIAPVPEPATMLLFGTGLVGLAGIVRRKKK